MRTKETIPSLQLEWPKGYPVLPKMPEKPKLARAEGTSNFKGAHRKEMDTTSLRCLYVAAEVAGFAKTGGLADVAGALPRALAQRGLDLAVILPLYRCARRGPLPLKPTEHSFTTPIGDRQVTGIFWKSTLPGCDVPVYLVDQPEYFNRDDPEQGRGLYQYTQANGMRVDYPDNCQRFVFFCRAILEAMRLFDFWPDVLHINDWQTGLVPVYLQEIYRRTGSRELREKYQQVRTLCTIHNLAYQGLFWHFDMPLLGLPWRLFTHEYLEFFGRINFLKAGLAFSDLLNTVSPTYAREIQTPYYGCGLQGVLTSRSRQLFGIVNGVDYEHWDPANDSFLPAKYTVENVAQGKATCKAELQKQFGLEENPRTPLLGMVSRLVNQKGLDLLDKAGHALLHQNVQLVVLGEGDPIYHQMLLQLQRRFPRQVGVKLGQDESLAHQVEAGADIFLMPSEYEPCGLNQMYSLKYGTVPLVRATGGLADTVVDATPENLKSGKATGFVFVPYSPTDFLDTVNRALALYNHQPQVWLNLQQTGMRQDWSWNRSAADYEKLYRRLIPSNSV
jgi:starch synthase